MGYIPVYTYFLQTVRKTLIITRRKEDYRKLQLGKIIYLSAKQSYNWQSGGNINLGVLTLLIPLIALYTAAREKNIKDQDKLRKELHLIVNSTTVEDAVYFYKTVNLVKPGGLGGSSEYDITDPSFTSKIRRDHKTLYDLFEISGKWDSISKEWLTSYQITYTIGEPEFTSTLNETKDINTATVHTFLKILSTTPDSLIKRKTDEQTAEKITLKAREALKLGGLKTIEGREYIMKLDAELQKSKGLLNPGSTADLTAASIMAALSKENKLPIY
ncbi:MAG: triphosphoribosyl-dephospho-CoA synthase [Candidatus Odinarchaeum yellowstonii]|uniref:Triphosphoribosyl-dephospho-CoA synthase n=1 Tax=Odinarchaeota yellowstonii (strain LCB_4) TaxID=1841599 RepID=A0AAF0D3L0_ODILC|nr:MAG: triphosphoribosyl-dephospho-CoA synthase [Candidatus Odinarchaeum yellowstonii]